MKSIRNNTTQLQVLTLKSGEILSLPPRSTKTVAADEVSADVEIKAARGIISIT
jgi:hypothetical protein